VIYKHGPKSKPTAFTTHFDEISVTNSNLQRSRYGLKLYGSAIIEILQRLACVRYRFDMCSLSIRYVFAMCSTLVRYVFDMCSPSVRHTRAINFVNSLYVRHQFGHHHFNMTLFNILYSHKLRSFTVSYFHLEKFDL
jgi:hypothetical protein